MVSPRKPRKAKGAPQANPSSAKKTTKPTVVWKPITNKMKAKAAAENPLSIILQRSPISKRPRPALPFEDLPEEEVPTLTALARSCFVGCVSVNTAMPPHYRFDAIAPYVEYKCGDDYSQTKPFPERVVDTPDDLTDSDGDGKGRKWMPYMPREYTCVTPPLLHLWQN